ncbi:MAG: NAD(P)-dependent oxidoreductase [Betaproteobacteria bacterium]
MNPSTHVGVIGLGLIGTSLAQRLLNAGYSVYGFDVNKARCDHLAQLGGEPCESAQAVGIHCKQIVFAVFNTDQVEALLEEKKDNPFYAHLGPQHQVICTSTCDPDRIESLASRLSDAGPQFLEAPLSGNSDQIAKGNGIFLIGGSLSVMNECAPVLEAIAKQHFFLGKAGSGGRAKLAVNLIGGLNRAVMAEGLAFAESMGLELVAFLEVLKNSAAYSRTMDNRGLKMIHSDYEPHAFLNQSLKDFTLMHEVASRVGQSLPLAKEYVEIVKSCISHGEGHLDNSVVMKEMRRRRTITD